MTGILLYRKVQKGVSVMFTRKQRLLKPEFLLAAIIPFIIMGALSYFS